MKKEQNLSSSVYELIKNKIINGEYMPGSVLMERSIAEEAGISRTPVREALKRLSQEGWIDWEERRRAIVSRITIEKILELFTLREMIEPFAIKKAIDDGRLYGSDDVRMGVAENHRAPGADVVGVPLAVSVLHLGPDTFLEEQRRAADRAEGAHRRIDAAGDVLLGAGEQGFVA